MEELCSAIKPLIFNVATKLRISFKNTIIVFDIAITANKHDCRFTPEGEKHRLKNKPA